MSNSSKNICFVNTTKAWGGGEKWHLDVSSYLSNKNYSVNFIVNRDSALEKHLSKAQINTAIFNVSNLSILNPFKIVRFINFFKINKIDVVVLNLPTDLKLAGIAAKLAGVKKIVYRRGSAIPIKDRFLNRFLLKSVVTKILANSEKTKETILSIRKDFLNPDKVEVIYNGIDLQLFPLITNKANNITSNKIVLGNVGRLVNQKGHEYLVDLGKILKQKQIPFKILIGGSGSLEMTLKAKIRAANLENDIELIGFCNDTPKFMNAIDIFILPSKWEGFGYVIAEAMACGKPVIAFDISSNPELIKDGENGFLIPPFDIDKMANKVITLYNDRTKLKEFGVNGRQIVEYKFDIEKIMIQIEKYLFNKI